MYERAGLPCTPLYFNVHANHTPSFPVQTYLMDGPYCILKDVSKVSCSAKIVSNGVQILEQTMWQKPQLILGTFSCKCVWLYN